MGCASKNKTKYKEMYESHPPVENTNDSAGIIDYIISACVVFDGTHQYLTQNYAELSYDEKKNWIIETYDNLSINEIDSCGYPLVFYVFGNIEYSIINIDTFKILIDLGVDIFINMQEIESTFLSLLCMKCNTKNGYECIKYLINSNIEFDTTQYHTSILHNLCFQCNSNFVIDIIEHLLKNKICPNVKTEKKLTPLMVLSAVAKNIDIRVQCIDKFIVAGTDINAQDTFGYNALMRACECFYLSGDPGIIYKLLYLGSKTNMVNNEGRNALILLCCKSKFNENNFHVLMALIRRSDITIVDRYKKSAYDYYRDKNPKNNVIDDIITLHLSI